MTAASKLRSEPVQPAWLVMASVCDCNKVAVTVMDAPSDPETWQAGWDGADPMSEVVRVGEDWRPLAREAATEMAQRTSLMISACCTAVYVDEPQRPAIENEVVSILYALIDEAVRARRALAPGPSPACSTSRAMSASSGDPSRSKGE